MPRDSCCCNRGGSKRCAKLFATLHIEPTLYSKLLLLILAALLSGCGHKGPLYLPGQKPPSGKPGTSQPASPSGTTPTDTIQIQP